MTTNEKWVALYSYSGSELEKVIEKTHRKPNLIITNGIKIPKGLYPFKVFTVKNLVSADYRNLFGDNPDNTLVTLHGWNRIVPGDICEEYTILNVHPGLISKYPELKGKDPQKKAFNLKLPTSGVTIHYATAELDSGPVVMEEEVDIQDCKTEIEVVDRLREISINLWDKILAIQSINA